MEQHFETHSPVSLYVELGKGSLTVNATDTTQSTVTVVGNHAEDVLVEQNGNQISIVAPRQRVGFFGGSEPSLTVTVTVPSGSDLITKTGSAGLVAHGEFGLAKVKSGSGEVRLDSHTGPTIVDTGSGDVTVNRAEADVRVKSGSGDVELGHVAGTVGISTGSGDISIGTTEAAAVIKSGSGDLSVENVMSDLSLSTASGDLHVGVMHKGSLQAKNASGDVHVGIPSGIPVWTDVSSVTGRIGSDLEGAGKPQKGEDYIEVRAKTVTGDITLTQI